MIDEIRFPLGQFVPVQKLTLEQRNKLFKEISELPKHLRFTVQHLSIHQLQTQYRPGGWTVQQIIHHMADNDINALIRIKKALTEDNPFVGSYREDLWADLNDYQHTPIEISLNLIELISIRLIKILSSLTTYQFQRTFKSPTHGLMDLDVAAQRYAWHTKHHIAQIESLKHRMAWQF